MDERKYTPIMGEISGMGGSYEEGCRAMVLSGVAWIEAERAAGREPDPQFHGFEGVYGLIMEDNEDAKALVKAMLDAPFIDDDKPTTVGQYGATGAMVQCCTSHVLFIKKNGWEQYAKEMSERKDEDTQTH